MKAISDFSADALSDRGNRVFEARLKIQDGKLVKIAEPVLLMDSWTDCDRDREDEILEQIFANLRKKQKSSKRPKLGNIFSLLAAGNVTVDGKTDNTNSPLRGLDLPADRTPYPLPVDNLPKPTRTGAELTLVFREVCQPIYELRG
ncbi:hypothetical protein PISMIDRAFT_688355 [Pisolithus microcarpus 441]|uniref:Uncharacterized protein n=1 Tax=Pisolithus microcarpus 441 TaxID=765257 RepID=A0A0C9XN61_9AGAM|nr:hypothetical protein PISMIDRAFT_688355 [Pisolithus microcarpus 441]